MVYAKELKIQEALEKYCELETLAEVEIVKWLGKAIQEKKKE